ncbi:hypothetical protein V866_000279 [Kwoniella sp. B9012]
MGLNHSCKPPKCRPRLQKRHQNSDSIRDQERQRQDSNFGEQLTQHCTEEKRNEKISNEPDDSLTCQRSSYTFIGRLHSPPFVFSSKIPTLTESNIHWLVTGDIDESFYLREEDMTRYTRSEDKVWNMVTGVEKFQLDNKQGKKLKRVEVEVDEAIDLTSAWFDHFNKQGELGGRLQ